MMTTCTINFPLYILPYTDGKNPTLSWVPLFPTGRSSPVAGDTWNSGSLPATKYAVYGTGYLKTVG